MRELADVARIRRFMETFGAAAPQEGTCYLVGGATAVLLGWRSTTIDIDIELDSEQDELLRRAAGDQGRATHQRRARIAAAFHPASGGLERAEPLNGPARDD